MEGAKTAEFCAGHAKEDMVDIGNRRCGHPGCNKQPTYDVKVARRGSSALGTPRTAW